MSVFVVVEFIRPETVIQHCELLPKIEPGDVVRGVLDPTRRVEHTPFRRGRVGPEPLEGLEIPNLEGDVTTARETGIFLDVRLVEPSEIRPP